jgi:hypothetical protein
MPVELKGSSSGDSSPCETTRFSRVIRWFFGTISLLIAMTCGYLALAAREAPAETWWAFWLIYGTVATGSLMAAYWLLKPRMAG